MLRSQRRARLTMTPPSKIWAAKWSYDDHFAAQISAAGGRLEPGDDDDVAVGGGLPQGQGRLGAGRLVPGARPVDGLVLDHHAFEGHVTHLTARDEVLLEHIDTRTMVGDPD